MSRKLKMLPAFIMLLAATFTSIITYLLDYETKTALFILLGVMLVFYLLGSILARVIGSFEKANEQEENEEQTEDDKPEGKVVEKEATPPEAGNDSAGKGDDTEK